MTRDPAYLAKLRRNLIGHFSSEELQTLCSDMGMDYDDLPGRGRADKARELVAFLDRHDLIPDLIEHCSRLRPRVPWQDLVAETGKAPTTASNLPPFKGLQYFDVADADLFAGRERLTAQLVGRLRGCRFLAVVGASGSGKSSVVRAGLIPALNRGVSLVDNVLPPEGSIYWPVHIITPGVHPLKELAASLARDSESVSAIATLMQDLACDVHSLDLAVSRHLKWLGGGNRLLLVVDQFEELFTACKDAVERKAFVDNLLHAAAPETEGATIVMIALRADFYAHCAQLADLREALAQSQVYIGPMNITELRQAIEEPARRHGWDFEPGLVDLLLRDVGDEPGALPLLSHALLETWKRRRGRTLTFAGYADTGGVRGAVAKTAETVFAQLKPEQQIIVRKIFLRLTDLGEGTQDTRRCVALTELAPRPEDAPAIEAVLKTLADARLITIGEGAAEVAHEALIREWPTLRKWLDEDREGLRLHRQLAKDAQGWQRLRLDEGALYRGARLAQALEWAENHPGELVTLEREFLVASRELAEREAAEREAQRQRELEAARKLAEETEARRRVEAEHTREALEEASKSQAILEAIADGVMVVNAQGYVILFNAAAERILDARRDEIIGRPIKDLLGLYGAAGVTWMRHMEQWSVSAGARLDLSSLEQPLQIENRHITVNVHVAPVTLGDEYLGAVSIFRDVTREVEADRAKSEFVSNVSFELRTPMTSIKGYTDLILLGAAGTMNDEQKRFLGIIKANADRLSTLINDLLDIGRIESQRVDWNIQPLALRRLVDQVADSWRGKIEEEGLKLFIDIPFELPAVLADSNRVLQILTNLVSNAYQYTHLGGNITLRAHRANEMVQVDVSDTGIGIALEDQPKIFGRFFRSDDPDVQKHAGTGLGLAIARALVEMQGGKIWFQSMLGQGSTFSFTLPIA